VPPHWAPASRPGYWREDGPHAGEESLAAHDRQPVARQRRHYWDEFTAWSTSPFHPFTLLGGVPEAVRVFGSEERMRAVISLNEHMFAVFEDATGDATHPPGPAGIRVRPGTEPDDSPF
jgi:hypothetical protein